MTTRFRVWDGEQMHEPPHPYLLDSGGNLYVARGHRKQDGVVPIEGGCEVMRYTGLDDAEGTPIYEGDVIRPAIGQFPNCSVTFRQFELPPITADRKFQGLCLHNPKDHRIMSVSVEVLGGSIVIGNRYENPELLEEVSA